MSGRTGVVVGTWPYGLPTDGHDLVRLAGVVENAGYDGLYSGDHLFGHAPTADALALVAAWAPATRRLTLGTCVLLPALRDAIVTAKQAATVDLLTGGRFVLGVGVGGEVEQEWRAAGVPAEGRGARTDEYLALMRQLWSGRPVEHEGRHLSVHGVTGSPLPATTGGPPVWIGGRSEAALARAIRHDGWCGYALSPRGLYTRIERLEELAGPLPPTFRIAHVVFAYLTTSRERGREVMSATLRRRYDQDLDRFLDAFCAVGDGEAIAERLAAWRAAGAGEIILSIQCETDELLGQVEGLASALRLGAER